MRGLLPAARCDKSLKGNTCLPATCRQLPVAFVTKSLLNVGPDVTKMLLCCYAKPLECLLTGQAGDVDNKEQRMRESIRMLAVGVLMLMLSAGAAFGAIPVLTGTNGDDQLKGTNKAEEIRGLRGEDEIVDGLGKDVVYGGAGSDNLIGYGGDTSVDRFRGAAGNDIFQPVDVPATKDRVSCGSGVDRVYADKADVVSDDCERVQIR
jgi:hypothetical protein